MSQVIKLWDGTVLPDIETLTGNSGGAVGPSGGNINVLGAGSLTVTGNPGTSTLTVEKTGSSFQAVHTVAQNNITGNGTTATVNFTTVRFDLNGDYDGTNTFTAPITGKYVFFYSVNMTSVLTATTGSIAIVTSNYIYSLLGDSPNATATGGGNWIKSISIYADMDAGDTATCTVRLNGIGADTADALAALNNTIFSGYIER